MSRLDPYKQTIQQIVELKSQEYNFREIGEMLSLPRTTVRDRYNRWLAEQATQMQEDSEIAEDLLKQSALCKAVQEYKESLNDEESLALLCEHPDFSISNLAKRLRTAHKTNTQLRKIQRETFDVDSYLQDLLSGVKLATEKVVVKPYNKEFDTHDVTPKDFRDLYNYGVVEVLFSDWQVGKIAENYNTQIAKERLLSFGKQVVEYIRDCAVSNDKGVEKIIFASLGDIVEDHMKHGIQSAVACDIGLSEQIATAIVCIWDYVLEPILNLGFPVEFIGITGNHGSSQHKGMDIFKAGLFSYDYTIYTTLKQLAKVGGYTNVTFDIPEGVFGHTEINGCAVIYEHGYFNKSTESSMKEQMIKRGQQIKKHVDYFRCGDMHHICAYDCGKQVLNGSFFGDDSKGLEYSGVLGFNATPAQVVMFHQLQNGKNVVKDFKTIQF